MRNNVLLAGGGGQNVGLDLASESYMSLYLGGGAQGALKIAHDMPPEYGERLKAD